MQDKTALGISDTFREFIEALVEEVAIKGEPFDAQKKWLRKHSEREGVRYETIENNLSDLFEAIKELEEHESRVVERSVRLLAKECYLSEALVNQLFDYAAEVRAQKEEDDKKENEAYRKCTSIEACDNYLKSYPQGRYALEVRNKKMQLEQDAEEERERKALEETVRKALDEQLEREYQRSKQLDEEIKELQEKLRLKEEREQKAKEERERKAKEELEQKQTTGELNGHEWVDLGLPSGTLWATCNVGASKPEDYGSYFAWGETTTKGTYNWGTYKYANGDWDTLTKYCNDAKYSNSGFSDKQAALQAGDDAATAKWGSGWRMPSEAQWEELKKNTRYQWMTKNGVEGCLFTSKKNGQTLFLPAASYCWDGEPYYFDHSGYWSRSLDTDYPRNAWIFSLTNCSLGSRLRGYGFCVRPVHEN